MKQPYSATSIGNQLLRNSGVGTRVTPVTMIFEHTLNSTVNRETEMTSCLSNVSFAVLLHLSLLKAIQYSLISLNKEYEKINPNIKEGGSPMLQPFDVKMKFQLKVHACFGGKIGTFLTFWMRTLMQASM